MTRVSTGVGGAGSLGEGVGGLGATLGTAAFSGAGGVPPEEPLTTGSVAAAGSSMKTVEGGSVDGVGGGDSWLMVS